MHPSENRDLALAIARQGALMSELSPRARPSVRSLMARNRLQSALSNAVIVVESGEAGGSLQTAAEARRQGRVLYAVDWPKPKPTAEGTRRLLSEGAVPVRGLDDVSRVVERVRARRPHGSGAEPDREPEQLSLF